MENKSLEIMVAVLKLLKNEEEQLSRQLNDYLLELGFEQQAIQEAKSAAEKVIDNLSETLTAGNTKQTVVKIQPTDLIKLGVFLSLMMPEMPQMVESAENKELDASKIIEEWLTLEAEEAEERTLH